MVGKLFAGEITSVEILGTDEKVDWKQSEYDLSVKMPGEKLSDYAVVVKFTLD